jgi:hypothetical protein
MKQTTLSALALGGAALAFASPGQAATCALVDVQYATACAGYVEGNIFNTADNSQVQSLLNDLGYGALLTDAQLTALWSDTGSKLSNLNGATNISFADAPSLVGTVLVGIHWGGQGGGQSAIYKLTIASGVSSINIDGQNPGGSSNAAMFLNGVPTVPEPASWALMICGLGIVGASMRRRKTEISFG